MAVEIANLVGALGAFRTYAAGGPPLLNARSIGFASVERDALGVYSAFLSEPFPAYNDAGPTEFPACQVVCNGAFDLPMIVTAVLAGDGLRVVVTTKDAAGANDDFDALIPLTVLVYPRQT